MSERWGRAHLDAIAPYVPGKPAEALAREQGITDAIKLASNENPMGPSPLALQAARTALTRAHLYPDDQLWELRARLASDLGVGGGELMFGHGSNELIDLLCRTLAGPEDHAVIGVPSFSAYSLCLQSGNVPFTAVPLRGFLVWDLEAVLAAITDRTRIVFIDNPGNPTSTHVRGADLKAFLQRVPEQVTVVIDEAYVEFVDAPDYVSALALRTTRERLVVLRTFSKAYGLAGLRVGFGVAPAKLVSYLQRVRLPFNVNSAAQAAALGSLDDPAHLSTYLAMNREERARITAALRDLGLAPADSQANFLTVPWAQPAAQIERALLRKGVIVRVFASSSDTWLRISIGLPSQNDRMLAALVVTARAVPG